MATPGNSQDLPTGVEEPAVPNGSGTETARNERDSLAGLGAELLRRAEESQPVIETAWDHLMARWGIHGQPVGIQRLRAMIQEECGANPEDNAFSRELIAQREERPS